MYVQGFLIPVPEGRKEDYRRMAEAAAPIFREYGATEIVECWEADVTDGHTTDFRRAVKAEGGEKIVFSWIIWPDRETCDAGHARIMEDKRFEEMGEMPFDGRRMIWGGFDPIVTMGR
ncbi:DUF1428 domain-containing protein [Croceicoccus sp. BE223]|uniref:DUF1428 domain-containing protein n=1 Tax=Croceicoccus sp. BE223 TaxID=2817716 RepID=UPI00285AD567|nr:DUF1428 domain-containing protein [Croceicoccus sp. BE223]MDR7102763.1 uncharacterized protein YbaA (DUF1428 family) [Croceicoccus sp. BE223]